MKALKCLVLHLVILLSISKASAINYYSRTTGNWDSNGTWSTVTYGNSTNTGTFPQAGDAVFIGNGHTITVNVNSACSNLDIGQGTSGIVTYTSAGNRTLTISGNLSVNSGGKLWFNKNFSRSHTLNLGGNLSNTSGIIDLYFDPNDNVTLNFTGNNSTVSGNGTYDLNNVTMNLISSSNVLDIQSTTFEPAIRNNVTFTQGKYLHNNNSTFNCNTTLNTTISENATIEIPLGTMSISNNGNYVYLQGKILVDGGTLSIAKSNGGNGLRSDQLTTGIPFLEVSSGTLNVNGGITYKITSITKPFHFKMSGGTINIENGTGPASPNEGLYVTDVSGSIFEMYGGLVIFHRPTIGPNLADVQVCGINGLVYSSGGVMQFGDGTTPASSNFAFMPYPSATYPNFDVYKGTLYPVSGGNTSDFQLLSLQIESSGTFDNRSLYGATGDNKDMYLRGNYNGCSFINNGTFSCRTGAVVFQDDTLQRVGGTVTTTLFDVTINNYNNVTLDTAVTIGGTLSLSTGLINTTSVDLLTLTSAAISGIGSSSSYVSGPMVRTVATSTAGTLVNFPIGAGGYYRPAIITVKHSTAAAVTYWGQVVNSPAAALSYSLPATLSSVSTRRYWQFVRGGASNFTNATMKLYYGLDDGVTDAPKLRVAQGVTSAWVDNGGTGSAAYNGNITSTSFATFAGIFSLANSTGGTNALPVELISFNASRTSEGNLLNWTTASEINNDYFSVERSLEGESFQEIKKVKGNGNSTSEINYSFTDQFSYNEVVYYRLKQFDFDGQFQYSEIKTVQPVKKNFLIYPSISTGENIAIQSDVAVATIQVQIVNSFGQIVSSQQLLFEGNKTILHETENLKAGIYYAHISNNDENNVYTFIIMK